MTTQDHKAALLWTAATLQCAVRMMNPLRPQDRITIESEVRTVDQILNDADKALDAAPPSAPAAELVPAGMRHVCNLWVDPKTHKYEVDRCDHPLDECVAAYIVATPAAEPEKQAAPVELAGIAEVLAEGNGFWRSCTGCHELNEGHATGPYSTTLKCNLGNGCDECGGIGAIWDTTDYQAMADAWDDPPAPSQQAAPAAEPTDEAIDALLDGPGNVAYSVSDKRGQLRLLIRAALRRFAAPAAEPQGVALVPLRPTQAMRDVMDTEGWTWADLLAAAEAITEGQYDALNATPAADMETFTAWLVREMPPGTVVSNPKWWAARILRAALRVAPAAEPARTDAQIVAQTEEVARLLMLEVYTRECPTDMLFRNADDPRGRHVWQLACKAQEILTATGPENAVAEVDEGIPAAESGEPFSVDVGALIPRLQSLLDRMCNDERTAAMFEADGDTLRDAIRLLRAIKRFQPAAATADAREMPDSVSHYGLIDERVGATADAQGAQECRNCHGTGTDGDVGDHGSIVEFPCADCRGTGQERLAVDKVAHTFENSPARSMVSADYATGYREALQHVRRAISVITADAQGDERAVARGRNIHYEGRFDDESEEMHESRKLWAADLKAALSRQPSAPASVDSECPQPEICRGRTCEFCQDTGPGSQQATDAARYRRIRNGPYSDRHGDLYAMTFQEDGDIPLKGEALDSAVDAALAAAKPEGGNHGE